MSLRRTLLITALIVYSLTVCVLDLITPLGVEVWVLNLPLVMVPVLFRRTQAVVFLGLASSLMLALGWLYSPLGGHNPPAWDALNRLMGLAVIRTSTSLLPGCGVGRSSSVKEV